MLISRPSVPLKKKRSKSFVNQTGQNGGISCIFPLIGLREMMTDMKRMLYHNVMIYPDLDHHGIGDWHHAIPTFTA
jgi:hypothetical protein